MIRNGLDPQVRTKIQRAIVFTTSHILQCEEKGKTIHRAIDHMLGDLRVVDRSIKELTSKLDSYKIEAAKSSSSMDDIFKERTLFECKEINNSIDLDIQCWSNLFLIQSKIAEFKTTRDTLLHNTERLEKLISEVESQKIMFKIRLSKLNAMVYADEVVGS